MRPTTARRLRAAGGSQQNAPFSDRPPPPQGGPQPDQDRLGLPVQIRQDVHDDGSSAATPPRVSSRDAGASPMALRGWSGRTPPENAHILAGDRGNPPTGGGGGGRESVRVRCCQDGQRGPIRSERQDAEIPRDPPEPRGGRVE